MYHQYFKRSFLFFKRIFILFHISKPSHALFKQLHFLNNGLDQFRNWQNQENNTTENDQCCFQLFIVVVLIDVMLSLQQRRMH